MTVAFSGFVFESDPRGGFVTRPDGSRTEHLTMAESQLLLYLVARPNRWISVTELSREIPHFAGINMHTLNVHKNNLCKKIDMHGDALIQCSAKLYRYACEGKRRVQIAGLDQEYMIEPATRQQIKLAAEHAATVYEGIDIIPASIILDWYDANPCGFTIIRNQHGEQIGNLDILPVREPALKDFLAGQTIEQDIKGSDLYRPAERDIIPALYIESIICPDPAALVPMLAELGGCLERICDSRPTIMVYAISATPEGENLVKHFGFDHLAKRDTRKDKHDLWGKDLPGLLKRAQARLDRLLGRAKRHH